MKKIIGIIILCFILVSAVSAETLTTNGGNVIDYAELPYQSAEAPATVYFINEITPEALMKAYEALGVTLSGKVGVKMSTGESTRSNYLRPALIGDLVRAVNGTIVECNTAYGGSRASTAKHRQQAEDNGLLEIAELDILDEEGSMELPINGGTRIRVDYVGSHFANYDAFLVLSHFKGHAMAGFGGAIKNISIGFGSSMGKVWIHSGGTRTSGSIFGDQDAFLEAMGDAAKGVDDHMGDRIVYISVMNRLSVDCDCDGSPAEPDMHDIGILASTDPLALDQACIDLVYASPDSASLVRRIESRNGLHTLEHAAEIGLGSRQYRLEQISDENNTGEKDMQRLTMIIGETPVNVEWENNESVAALTALAGEKPLTIQMSMYGGFEQVGPIGQSLPRNDVQTVTNSGDIVLYSGNQIVVFYGSNSWAYTRLGHISDKSAQEMAELLGRGNVTITIGQ